MREKLIEQSVRVLEDHNFDILLYLHSCLDIAAQKQKKSLSLLIKVLENIDGFRNEHALELKKLSNALTACPLLIGTHSKSFKMKDEIIYDRYDIPALTVGTFNNILAGAYPTKIYSKGRIITEIDGQALKEARELRHMSMQEFSKKFGVSKESIYFYERGSMRIRHDIAKKIERFLDTQLISTQSVLKPSIVRQQSNPQSAIAQKLVLFDFNVQEFDKLGLDIAAYDQKNKLIVQEHVAKNIDKIVEFSDFFKALLAFISERELDRPVIRHDELEAIESKKEFIKLLKQRAG